THPANPAEKPAEQCRKLLGTGEPPLPRVARQMVARSTHRLTQIASLPPAAMHAGNEPVLNVAREVARVAPAKLGQLPVIARDDLSAFWCAARAFHVLGRIAVDHGVVDGQL